MKVAVIQGGPSLEAAVSRVSAAAVEKALLGEGHEVGRFELGPALSEQLLSFAPSVVFPAVHGAQGEDGCLQGLLEILRLPYVGSGVLGSSMAASKVVTKQLYMAAGLPVARQRVLHKTHEHPAPELLLSSLRDELGPRLIMKPALGGSALGIVRLLEDAQPEHVRQGLETIFEIDETILVEEYITGAELTCGVLEREGEPVALPVTMISAEAADWYDFKSKYAAGGSRHQCPAPLAEPTTQAIQLAAVAAHRLLGLRDLSRTDVIARPDGSFVLLETNTLPGMTDVSLFPEAAGVFGIPFSKLIVQLCSAAIERGGAVTRPETEMP